MQPSKELSLRRLLASQFDVQRRAVASQKLLPDDLWEFCQDCVFTFDERSQESGLSPEQPFPDKIHLKLLAAAFQSEKYVSVEKSRQIMVTWLMAAAAVHRVLIRRGQNVGWRCKEFQTAAAHIERRLYRIVQQLPPGWKVPHVKLVGDELLVYHDGPERIATSRVVPLAAETGKAGEAAKRTRSETWSLIVDDESAFNTSQDELHFSALPSTGAMWKVSTPNGITFFHRLGYGDVNDPTSPLEAPDFWSDDQIARGCWRWERNGFLHYRIHYSADPDKDPDTVIGRAWYETERAKYSTSKWSREMEIDSRVAAGVSVYSDFDAVHVSPQSFDPKLGVSVGWDFGRQVPAVLVAQIEPGKTVHILREITGTDVLLTDFARRSVIPWLDEVCPFSVQTHFGDVAGRQHDDKLRESSIELLGKLGIHVRSKRFEIEASIELVQAVISRGLLEIDPSCRTLIESLRAGYVRDESGFPIKDGVFDHIVDALRYLLANVFRLTDQMDLEWIVDVNANYSSLPPPTLFQRKR